MPAYYNEIDPFASQWLRNLIAEGHIAPGDVDERSIVDVRPDDLRGYTQVHLFAGIAGWSRALRLAGWDDVRPILTASCPCPPFSSAGKKTACPSCSSGLLVWCPRRTGFAICAECSHAWLADARHLWPEAWRLIAELRPQHVIGEQVASPSGLVWLAGVRGSLEILGYGLGASDLPACSVGAPHIRQRLFWMAHAGRSPGDAEHRDEPGQGLGRRSAQAERAGVGERGSIGGMANPKRPERGPDTLAGGRAYRGTSPPLLGDGSGLGDTDPDRRGTEGRTLADPEGCDPQPHGRLVNPSHTGLPAPERKDLRRTGRGQEGRAAPQSGAARPAAGRVADTPGGQLPQPERRQEGGDGPRSTGPDAALDNFWANAVWLPCLDGKARRAQSPIYRMDDGLPDSLDGLRPINHPLAPAAPGRVGQLRAFGNAIVPPLAAEFIKAFMETEQ